MKSLMNELKNIKSNVKPHEILLGCRLNDRSRCCKCGQSHLMKNLGIDGVVLTKLDGDTRGGAAISVKEDNRKTY